MKVQNLLLFSALICLASSSAAALFEREVYFTEGDIQEALVKAGPQSRSYGRWMTISLLEAPKISLGQPEGRVGINTRIHVSLLGNQALPVDVVGSAGIRYDDQTKAFFLENPVTHSITSQGIPKEAEPGARQTANTLISAYFRSKPIYVLRDDGTAQEATARWLLKSVRIESGKVVAVLSAF